MACHRTHAPAKVNEACANQRLCQGHELFVRWPVLQALREGVVNLRCRGRAGGGGGGDGGQAARRDCRRRARAVSRRTRAAQQQARDTRQAQQPHLVIALEVHVQAAPDALHQVEPGRVPPASAREGGAGGRGGRGRAGVAAAAAAAAATRVRRVANGARLFWQRVCARRGSARTDGTGRASVGRSRRTHRFGTHRKSD